MRFRKCWKRCQYLRYFYEEASDIPVIAAGSILERLFNPDISFPVGRVEYLVIQPVSFPEFLGAIGETSALLQDLTVPMATFAHYALLKLFRTYCPIGGMPEIVAHYAAQKDLVALGPIYESSWFPIWMTWRNMQTGLHGSNISGMPSGQALPKQVNELSSRTLVTRPINHGK